MRECLAALTRDEIYEHVLIYEIICRVSQGQLLGIEERKQKEGGESFGRKIWQSK